MTPRRFRPSLRSVSLLAALLAVMPLASGCTSLGTRLAFGWIYREAPLPPQQVVRDVPYRAGPGADPVKHRLDLFLPDPRTSRPWPVLVFVHGGGWTSGDRALRFAGADVYGNIGRFYASRGVGSAVISYRLQPEVGWRDQVADVAAAVGWVYEHIDAYGGNPNALFLAGHSAGAQLAARVAFDDEAQRVAGIPPESICGLVPVSGSAYDLEEPIDGIGPSLEYFEARFAPDPQGDAGGPDVAAGPTNGRAGARIRGDGEGEGDAGGNGDEDWRREASIVPLIDEDPPPALVMWALGDWPVLREQSRILARALRAHGAEVRELQVPLVEHFGIVGALSRDDRTAGPAILEFVREQTCREAPGEMMATGGDHGTGRGGGG